MTEPNGGGSFPNRAHYLKASLAGGGVAVLLSMVPVVNVLNLFFGLLIMAGGAFAVYLVQKKTESVQLMEATVLGLLAGLVAGMIVFTLTLLLGVPLFGLMLADAPSYREDDIVAMAAMTFTAMCCGGVTIYPMLGAIGGAVGGMIWSPSPGQLAVGGDGQPLPKPAPTPEELAKKKKVKNIALVTCSGCLLLMLAGCGLSGYLVYLESRDPDDTAGQDGVAEIVLQPGTLQQITIPGEGSARYGIWLVGTDDLPAGIDVSGEMDCSPSYLIRPGEEPSYMRRLYTYSTPDESHPEWLFLDSEYAYSSGSTICTFRVTPTPAVAGARIVVTQVERPSDWLD